MKGRLLRNIPIKLFALIIACVLWLHVATEQTYEHTYNFPLSVEGLPDEYVIGAPLPDSIGVIIRGRGKDLLKLLFADLSATIDGSGFKYSERFYNLADAKLSIPDKDYTVVGYTRPEPIHLVIDRYDDRRVPVVSALYLETAEGFAAKPEKTTFEPAFVIIGGPEKQVRGTDEVYTLPETLRYLSANTGLVVDIERGNELLTYTPNRVSATIIVERLVRKKLYSIPVQIKGGEPQGLKLKPETIDLVFTGTKGNIDSLEAADVSVFVDYTDDTTEGAHLKPVVIHPSGVRVVTMRPGYFIFTKG